MRFGIFGPVRQASDRVRLTGGWLVRSWSASAQRGSIVVMMLLTTIPMMAIAGLSIEVANFFLVRSELQAALDHSVLSAARELQAGRTDPIPNCVNVSPHRIYTRPGEDRERAALVAKCLFDASKPVINNVAIFARGDQSFVEFTNPTPLLLVASSSVVVKYKPLLLKMFGSGDITYSVKSNASFSEIRDVEIVFAIDFSDAMAAQTGSNNYLANVNVEDANGNIISYCRLKSVSIAAGCKRKIDLALGAVKQTLTRIRDANLFQGVNVRVAFVPFQSGVRLPSELYQVASGRSPPYTRLTLKQYVSWSTNDLISWGGYTPRPSIGFPARLRNPVPPATLYSEQSLILPHDNTADLNGRRAFKNNGGDLDVEHYPQICQYAQDVIVSPPPCVVPGQSPCPFGRVTSKVFCTIEHKCLSGRYRDLSDDLPTTGNYYDDNIDRCLGPPIFPLVDVGLDGSGSNPLDTEIARWMEQGRYGIDGPGNGEAGIIWARNLLSHKWQPTIQSAALALMFAGENAWSAQASGNIGGQRSNARKIIIMLTSGTNFFSPAPVLKEASQIPTGENPLAPQVVKNYFDIAEHHDGWTPRGLGDIWEYHKRFVNLCSRVKEQDRMEIFIIGFDLPYDQAYANIVNRFIRPCASGPQYFYIANTFDELRDSFFDILDFLQSIRLDG